MTVPSDAPRIIPHGPSDLSLSARDCGARHTFAVPANRPPLFMADTHEQPRLRIVTFTDHEPDAIPASGYSSSCSEDEYLCDCEQHAEERARVVKRGVRPRQPPLPRKRAA